MARTPLQTRFTATGTNFLVSVLGHDGSACTARHYRGRGALSDCPYGLAAEVHSPLLQPGGCLGALLAFRRHRVDLALPVAVSHQPTLMHSTIVPKKTFYIVWAALLFLLLLTWGLAQLDLHHFNVAAALSIALLKM